MQGLSPVTAASAAAFRAAHSSRRLQRTWRRFAAQRKTTAQLARTFAALGITNLDLTEGNTDAASTDAAAGVGGARERRRSSTPGMVMIGGLSPGKPSPHHMRFEDFAAKLQSPETLKAAQALLRRLEYRLSVRGATNDGAQALLRQLNPSAPAGRQLDRYPVRVMLCAYMIKEHPEVIFNTVGDVEARLSAAADQMVNAFEDLLSRLLQPTQLSYNGSNSSLVSNGHSGCSSPTPAGPARSCPSPLSKSMVTYMRKRSSGGGAPQPAARQLFVVGEDTAANGTDRPATNGSSRSPASSLLGASSPTPSSSLGQLLVAFDDSWLEYLDQFVVWKGRDAAALERELTQMAVKLERSMRIKLGRRELGSPEVTGNPDLQAMVSQVSHDHHLLAERIARLTGVEGSARLQAALEQVRQGVLAELQAAEEAAAAGTEFDSVWEEASEAGSRPMSRASTPVPRSLSRNDGTPEPLSDAEGLAASQNSAEQAADAQGAQDGSPAQQQADGLGNEQMVWEMLYNPAYSLPTEEAEAAWYRAMGRETAADAELDPSDVESMSPEQLTAAVTRRARAIAERAFWDFIVWRFKTAAQGQALPAQLAPLLAELGTELSSIVTDTLEAQQLTEQYTERAVLERLRSRTGEQGGGANLTAVGSMMEQLAQVLLRSGGAERAAEAADAVQHIQASMTAALAAAAAGNEAAVNASNPTNPTVRNEVAPAAAALAEALAAALRLLMTQLKVVKLDAANTRLRGLARAMRDRGAVSYLQTKLATAWQFPSADDASNSSPASLAVAEPAAIAERLPLTAAWVRQAQAEMVLQLRSGLSAAGLLLGQQAATAAVVAGGLQSVELRSGVRAAPRAASPTVRPSGSTNSPRSPGSASSAVSQIKPVFPVTLDSWQGAVRAGLLALVTGDTPAAGPILPEILTFDRVRLHEQQNGLQQLLVTAAGLLIIQQLRTASGLVWDAEVRSQARRRLMVVLSDPGMKLSHLVTELTQLAGATGVATEQRVKTMFTSIVDSETAAFRSIRSAVGVALAAHLLYGKAALAADATAAASCNALLGRVGAAALYDDVADLGEKLAGVAAVNEAVHGHWLATLAAAN
eukprot:GHUV01022492.1.p1 GENE.GHUV01022492.1~~GHUV01022492.1.p1  ORF type:complete len:1095 (+),score=464.09 GHUV01022492.1:138-3422(+)